MNGNVRWIGIALIGVATFLLPSKAAAVCGASVTFGGYYTRVPAPRPARRVNFWILNQGDPAVGIGIDTGNVPHDVWMYAEKDGEVPLLSDWGRYSYDGCPNSLPNAGGTSSMVFSLSDVNASGNMTYAVICATRYTFGYPEYNTDYPPGCLGGTCLNPLPMIQGPQATISNIVRGSANDVTVTVASPNFAAGFYGDGTTSCTVANAIPRYDVYVQQVARGAFPNPSIDAGPWVLSATCNIGLTVHAAPNPEPDEHRHLSSGIAALQQQLHHRRGRDRCPCARRSEVGDGSGRPDSGRPAEAASHSKTETRFNASAGVAVRLSHSPSGAYPLDPTLLLKRLVLYHLS